jgi:hypothetical protein
MMMAAVNTIYGIEDIGIDTGWKELATDGIS